MTSPSVPARALPFQPRIPFAAPAAPASMLRSAILFLLVFVIYVSPPRLNVGAFTERAAQPKTIDVRAEDVLLAGILAIWIVRPSFVRWRSPLKALILFYLGWSVAATVFAVTADWVDKPLRAVFYTGKEVEYFLFFAAGLFCVRRSEDLKAGIAALVCGALVQGGYAVFQLSTGKYGGTYAVALLGDKNPHIAGLCGCLSLCLGIVLFNATRPRRAVLAVACAGLGGLTIMGTISRTAIFAAGGAAFVLLLLELPQRRGILPRWAPIGLMVVVGLGAGVAYTALSSEHAGRREVDLVERRIDPLLVGQRNLEEFRKSRVDSVYAAYWDLVQRSPVLGNGKSITGSSDERNSETHNYYLRLVVETGVVGLLLYLAMMLLVLRSSFRLYRHGQPTLVRRVGLLCLLFTVVLLVAAMANDVFIIPRIAGLYWTLVGMVMSAERLNLFARRRV
jgi:O-antigen ligase